jgi:hypothetical protein
VLSDLASSEFGDAGMLELPDLAEESLRRFAASRGSLGQRRWAASSADRNRELMLRPFDHLGINVTTRLTRVLGGLFFEHSA